MRIAHSFEFKTKDGRTGCVRDARPSDSKPALAGVSAVVRERPRTLLVGEDEIWTARQWRDHRLHWCPDGAWLSAELEGKFVGLYTVHRRTRRAERHKAEFGIWLIPEARGLGIGKAMLAAGEVWASEHGILRIELGVFADNQRAQKMYLAAGYQVEAVMRRAYRLPSGEVLDSVRMAKLL